jgi:hypothetical protein
MAKLAATARSWSRASAAVTGLVTVAVALGGCSSQQDCPAALFSPGVQVDASALAPAGLGQSQPSTLRVCVGTTCRLAASTAATPWIFFVPVPLPAPGVAVTISLTVPAGASKGAKVTYSGPVVATAPWGKACARVDEIDLAMDKTGHLTSGGHRRDI